jgi:hypothetical protein
MALKSLKQTIKARELTEALADLLQEREERLIYDHYIAQGHYVAGERLRHPKRKGSLVIAGCVPVPVRYNKELEPTHVLCWKPQTDVCRWVSLSTGQFLMKDLGGIPEQFHINDAEWEYVAPPHKSAKEELADYLFLSNEPERK